jgi:tRNA dimethylallyltransferase
LERDRKNLYERIDKRVDIMFREGLLPEAKVIYDKYADKLEKIQAIGYKELFAFFKGEISLEEATELIKRESRRYAKRQFTWFRRDKKINWFNLDKIDEESVKKKILEMLR